MIEWLFAFILGLGVVAGLTGAIAPSGKISASILVSLFIIASLAAFDFVPGSYPYGRIHTVIVQMIVLSMTKHYYFLIFGAVSGVALSLYEEGTLENWYKSFRE